MAVAEIAQLGNGVRNVSECGFQGATAVVCIAAKAPKTFDLDGEVEFPFFFKASFLRLIQDSRNKLSGGIDRQVVIANWFESAVQSHHRRRSHAQVDI